LRNKIAVAAVVKAQAFIVGATPTSNQLTWSRNTLERPLTEADFLLNYILAANRSLTAVQISNASDVDIQTQVNTAVDALVGGGVIE
jgi:hypothetical protein